MILNNPDYMIIVKQTVDPTKPEVPGTTIKAALPETFGFDTSAEYATPYAQGLFSGGLKGSSTAVKMANVAGKVAGAAAPLLGMRMTAQALTAQLWQGQTDSDLMIELDFVAENDPDAEVRQPVLALMKLSTASVDPASGMLLSPGPNLDLRDAARLIENGYDATKDALQTGAAAIRKGVMNGENANLNGKNQANAQPAYVGGVGGSQFWKSNTRNQISIQIGTYALFDSVVILNVQKTYQHTIDAETGLPMFVRVSVRFRPLFMVTQQDLEEIFALRTGRQGRNAAVFDRGLV